MLFHAFSFRTWSPISTLALHLSKKYEFLDELFHDSAAPYQVSTAPDSTFHNLGSTCGVMHLVGEIDLLNFVRRVHS